MWPDQGPRHLRGGRPVDAVPGGRGNAASAVRLEERKVGDGAGAEPQNQVLGAGHRGPRVACGLGQELRTGNRPVGAGRVHMLWHCCFAASPTADHSGTDGQRGWTVNEADLAAGKEA